MNRRKFFCICAALALSPVFAQDINITVEGDAQRSNVPIYKVALESSDSQTAAYAKRAFSTHGSYVITTPENAQFVFSFEPHTKNSVKATIKGAGSMERIISGSNQIDALLRACDFCVEKTLRTPGYFGGKLAFAYSKKGGSTTEIAVSDMVFKNIRVITSDKSDSLWPHFSPDGT